MKVVFTYTSADTNENPVALFAEYMAMMAVAVRNKPSRLELGYAVRSEDGDSFECTELEL